MIDFLTSIFSKKNKVLILGYGKEGRSTYCFLRRYFPNLQLGIADINTELNIDTELLTDNKLEIITGSNYIDSLKNFDLIIKSPGVIIDNVSSGLVNKITSQTDLFLQHYAKQVIGVTGTKGKSTTASLIKHMLDAGNKKALLLGNIGVPAFDMIDAIDSNTIIVYELSAHQLEYLRKSPHIALLLNIFPEHLDYFNSVSEYRDAKLNICKFQNSNDCLIIHESLGGELRVRSSDNRMRIIEVSDNLSNLKIVNPPLVGNHNLININAAIEAVKEAGLNTDVAVNSLSTFRSLPHRLEYVGEFEGIRFVNDSISTVPESTIAAVKALETVDTIILGGYDRDLDYTEMIDFLATSNTANFIFLGEAGNRMYDIFKSYEGNNLFRTDSIEGAFEIILNTTTKGMICLLSPAAASYDQFHNFEHRGDTFKSLAKKL